ncbi:EAL domain-containing protein [Agaribacterium sp. ZY112]|uniref:EAL domain-containing response regulator n=1 Tax=Agaribacterium sp. ZY112 TaxID=3233574 RepID=UPI00352369F5
MDSTLKVLVVDDSLSQCQLLCNYLSHYGVSSVEYCHDGQAALDKVDKDRARPYDAIFIDLHMEGMDGLELMQQLNKRFYRGGVVIVSSLDSRIIDYTMEVVSDYNLRLLGSIEKPIERSLVAFMVRRIRSFNNTKINPENLPKRRDINVAMLNNQLEVYFQPIINADNNTIYSLECLCRLNMDGRGCLTPSDFLPVIEKFDLFPVFMEKLIEAAAQGLTRFEKKTGLAPIISINLSPRQLLDECLPETLNELLKSKHIDKSRVKFEITENDNLNADVQKKNLSRLRIQGFDLSLDDYGAGYTNLRQIIKMPFTEIKLDTELINGMHKDRVLRIIVESIQNLCAELKLDLVAEGVANAQDLILLDDIGVRLFQGYFFSRPKPIDELIRWYQSWQKTIEASCDRDKRFFDKR